MQSHDETNKDSNLFTKERILGFWNLNFIRKTSRKMIKEGKSYFPIKREYADYIPDLLFAMNDFYKQLEPHEVIIVRLKYILYNQEEPHDEKEKIAQQAEQSFEIVVKKDVKPFKSDSTIENIGNCGYYIEWKPFMRFTEMKYILVDNNEVKANKNRKGSFFKLSSKINTNYIDLRQLQIYNYDDDETIRLLQNKNLVKKHDISLHCLVYTLKFQGCPPEIYQGIQDKIIFQKHSDAGDRINLIKVTEILTKYGGEHSYAIQYKLKTNELNQYKYKFIRCNSIDSANYRICYHFDHYFPWIMFPVSRCYLENCKWQYIKGYRNENPEMEEYLRKLESKGKDLKKMTKCLHRVRDGKYVWNSTFDNQAISSMELVDYLLQEPQAFREITATELDNTRYSAVVRKNEIDLDLISPINFEPVGFVDKQYRSYVGRLIKKITKGKYKGTHEVLDWMPRTLKFENGLPIQKETSDFITESIENLQEQLRNLKKCPHKAEKSLRVVSLNIRGLENRYFKCIKREVFSFFFKEILKADIIVLQETKAANGFEWYMFPNWHLVPSSNNYATNGVAVLVRPGLSPYIKQVHIEDGVQGNLVAIDCHFQQDIRIIGMYYPAEPEWLKDKILNKLNKWITECPKTVLLTDGNGFIKRDSHKELENYTEIIDKNNMQNIFDGKPTFTTPDGRTSSLDSISISKGITFENDRIFQISNIWAKFNIDHALLMTDLINEAPDADLEGPIHIPNPSRASNVSARSYWPVDQIQQAYVVTLDFETSTQGKHVPYQLGYTVTTASGDIVKSGCASGYEGHSELIPQVMRELPSIFIGYFHNLTYDVSFLLRHIEIKSITRRAGSFYAVDGVYKEMDKENPEKLVCFRRFRIYDSYKFLNFKLSALPGMLFTVKDRLSEKEYERYKEIENDKTISDTTRMHRLNKFMDEESSLAKEKLPYRWYTKENILNCLNGKLPTLRQIKSYLESTSEYSNNVDDYLKALKRWKPTTDLSDNQQTIDMLAYSAYYCQRDCEILAKCIHAFNKFCVQQFNLSMFNYVSISSMGDALAIKKGCYDGVVKMTGTPRAFIQKAIYGGRVMLADNKKQSFIPDMEKLKPYLDPNDKGGEPIPDELAVDDMDAVGLYTSTMALMHGIPKGEPNIFRDEELIGLRRNPDQFDDYYVEVEVIDPGKTLHFPVLPHRKPDGGVEYNLGQVPHEPYTLVLNKITILDAIKFQGVKFRFIRGIYFDEGVNMGISYLADELTNLRNQLKRQGNPMQTVVKLLCNSLYGKTILKESDTKTVIMKDNETFLKYALRHGSNIAVVNCDDDDPNFRVLTVRETIGDHWTRPQAGARILAYSKHIMCRLFHIAEQNGLKIFYQDTDSIQGPRRDIRLLAKAMEEAISNGSLETLRLPPRERKIQEKIYIQREVSAHPGIVVSKFEGKGIGNFHSDFEVSNVVPVRNVPIVGVGAIYVGKKSYCVMLRSVHLGDDGKPIPKISYHCRLKGIPKYAILDYCKKHGINEFELYQKLAAGEKVQFNLASEDHVVFRKTSTINQISIEKFDRNVSF